MASSIHFVLFLTLLLVTSVVSRTSFRPKALVLPVKKDHSTLEYVTTIQQRTPLIPIRLTLDLGGPYLWVDCDVAYVSSTYRPARCGSAQCSLAGSISCGQCFSPPSPNCNNNTCSLFPDSAVIGEVAADVVSVHSTDGKKPGRIVSVPQFIFSCSSTFLLESLAGGVRGKAGLGRNKISLPSQFSAAFSFDRTFAMCLTSSTDSKGVIIFGDGPYVFLPGIDVSDSLIYTPLITKPVSRPRSFIQGEGPSEYFIGIESIKINEKNVPLNKTLLSVDSLGYGGTKISTVYPYTTLESSIYQALTDLFLKELSGVPRVAPVDPFGVCFNAANVSSTRVGPDVPSIDLVLQSEGVVWRIFGANSMVSVSNRVVCLGFVDGGVNLPTSIVIGGHQLEDNLLQFDLATSRLGFSSSLLFKRTTCANFNFTTDV